MSDKVIPAPVKLAAKRAFIRTLFQSWAATLSAATLTSGAVLALANGGPDAWKAAAISAGAAVLAGPVGGLVAYFQYVSRGIPEDYLPAAREQSQALTRRAYRASIEGGE